jgi:prephenate dehydrogenase
VARGAVDEGLPLAKAVPQSDLVYLSQPIERILELLPQVAELARPGALVTDAGSTKRQIVETARASFTGGALFLGGHPMAGKEQRGVERAEADLFQDATYVVTPHEDRLPSAAIVEEFVSWVRGIGARPVVFPAAEHDRIVGWTSHLPQILATALASSVYENVKDEDSLRVAGPGLRGMTRLAESPYDVWKDIFATNTADIVGALDAYIDKLTSLRNELTGPKVAEEFEVAQELRRKFHSD